MRPTGCLSVGDCEDCHWADKPCFFRDKPSTSTPEGQVCFNCGHANEYTGAFSIRMIACQRKVELRDGGESVRFPAVFRFDTCEHFCPF